LTANISRSSHDIDKRTKTLSRAVPAALEKKISELLFTNKKVIDADVDLPKFKIWRDFGQLQTLTADISGADRHTENR